MKNTFGILLALLLSFAAEASVVVTNLVTDGLGNPLNLTVQGVLISPPYSNGTNSLTINSPFNIPVTNGIFKTNFNTGLYLLTFGNYISQVQILVPASGGPYDIGTIATNLVSFQVTNYMPLIPITLLTGDATFLSSAAGYHLGDTNFVFTNFVWRFQPATANGSNWALTAVSSIQPAATLLSNTASANLGDLAENNGLLTNHGLVWVSSNWPSGTAPGGTYPLGSFATGTNSTFWLYNGSTWVQAPTVLSAVQPATANLTNWSGTAVTAVQPAATLLTNTANGNLGDVAENNGLFTNHGVVEIVTNLPTGTSPGGTWPWGSLCRGTNGTMWFYSNGWLQVTIP